MSKTRNLTESKGGKAAPVFVGDCPFNIGDIVRHKTSGELAIVTNILRTCKKHSVAEHLRMNFAELKNGEHRYGSCVLEYTGIVVVSVGLQYPPISVSDALLEKVRTDAD